MVSPVHGPHPLSKGGQVVIPKVLQRKMNLAAGDSVYFIEEDDRVFLVPGEALQDASRKVRSVPRPRRPRRRKHL